MLSKLLLYNQPAHKKCLSNLKQVIEKEKVVPIVTRFLQQKVPKFLINKKLFETLLPTIEKRTIFNMQLKGTKKL